MLRAGQQAAAAAAGEGKGECGCVWGCCKGCAAPEGLVLVVVDVECEVHGWVAGCICAALDVGACRVPQAAVCAHTGQALAYGEVLNDAQVGQDTAELQANLVSPGGG